MALFFESKGCHSRARASLEDSGGVRLLDGMESLEAAEPRERPAALSHLGRRKTINKKAPGQCQRLLRAIGLRIWLGTILGWLTSARNGKTSRKFWRSW